MTDNRLAQAIWSLMAPLPARRLARYWALINRHDGRITPAFIAQHSLPMKFIRRVYSRPIN
jgi:hypothetical protein